jgi:uncharacterized SAM-binding protein YcdF (DUF218 family)
VLVVLGAGLSGDRPSPTATARLRHAAALYRTSAREPLVVVSGGRPPGGSRTEAAAMAEALVELGVAPEHVLQEDRAASTADNLRLSAALLAGTADAAGPVDPTGDDVVVVTSGLHRWRTALLARGLGLRWRVTAAPVPRPGRARAALREVRLVVGQLLTRAPHQE